MNTNLRRGLKLFTFAILMTAVSAAKADFGIEFIWNNTEGFESADRCRKGTTTVSDFHALDSTEGFRSDRLIPVNLLDGTIVMKASQLSDLHEQGETYRAVQVIAAPRESEMVCNRVAKRSDLGYISSRRFLSLHEFEIKILSLKYVRAELGHYAHLLKGAVLRPAKQNNKYVVFNCRSKRNEHVSHFVFDLFADSDSKLPVARVGISKNATELLADVDVRRVALTKFPLSYERSGEQGQPIEGLEAKVEAPPTLTTEEARSKFNILTPTLPKGVSEPGEVNFAGAICSSTDRDPVRCLVCMLDGEQGSEKSTHAAMLSTARTAMQRYEVGPPLYPKDICKIVYAPGQYVALYHGRRVKTDRTIVARMTAAARDALMKGGEGYLGFRTCSYLKENGIPYDKEVGGNCFLRKGALGDPAKPAPIQAAEIAEDPASHPENQPTTL